MNQLKENNEKAVGEAFIEWLNEEQGSNYCFTDRPDIAPDLRYFSNGNELLTWLLEKNIIKKIVAKTIKGVVVKESDYGKLKYCNR